MREKFTCPASGVPRTFLTPSCQALTDNRDIREPCALRSDDCFRVAESLEAWQHQNVEPRALLRSGPRGSDGVGASSTRLDGRTSQKHLLPPVPSGEVGRSIDSPPLTRAPRGKPNGYTDSGKPGIPSPEPCAQEIASTTPTWATRGYTTARPKAELLASKLEAGEQPPRSHIKTGNGSLVKGAWVRESLPLAARAGRQESCVRGSPSIACATKSEHSNAN